MVHDPLATHRARNTHKAEKTWQPIVVILAVVWIIVILSFTFVDRPFIRSDKQTPTVGMVSFLSEQGDYVISFEKVDPSPVSYMGCDLTITESNGTGDRLFFSPMADIYGIDLEWGSNNVSMLDAGVDGKISPGDYIIIRSVENGGIGRDGLRCRLRFNPNDATMGTVYLHSETVHYVAYTIQNLPKMVIHGTDQENFSMNQSNAILNRFQCGDKQTVEYNAMIDYSGDKDRSVIIKIMKNGIQFDLYSELVQPQENITISGSYVTSADRITWELNHNFSVSILDDQNNDTLLSFKVYHTTHYGSKSTPSFSVSGWGMIIPVMLVCFFRSLSTNTSVSGKEGGRGSGRGGGRN